LLNPGADSVLILVYLVKKELLTGEAESIMMGIFQQKYTTEQEDTTTPEHYLWVSVLSKAAHDAIYSSDWREAKLAIAWFKGMSVGFREVCSYAGKDPYYVHKRMIVPIAKREAHMEMICNGGRYYVKETLQPPKQYHSYYRAKMNSKIRGPYKKRKRPPHKWRCGAQKKDLKMVLRGSKGGRPRLYVV
jgi:hypothetical protein|tara:strand:+ start:27 stop:593 length:567 start_codon:yes stop_codon:yes gene_type:complete